MTSEASPGKRHYRDSESPERTDETAVEGWAPENDSTLQIILDLRSCLLGDTESYLNAIMTAAEELPSAVVAEIRKEVQTRLQVMWSEG